MDIAQIASCYIEPSDFQTKSLLAEFNMEIIENVDAFGVRLLATSTSLNHWLPGSQVRSLLKHLQVLVTTMLLESTSRQTVEPFVTLDEKCILESEIISHLELGPEHIIPSFAAFPT